MRASLLLSLALLPGAAAFGEEPVRASADETRIDVEAAVRDALEAGAELPRTPPSLPDPASDRAREVHATTAFGQKGEELRAQNEAAQAARDEARARGLERAREAASRSNQNAQRGLDQAGSARGDEASRRATGRARAEEARRGGR